MKTATKAAEKAVRALVLVVGLVLLDGFTQVYLGAELGQLRTGATDLSSRDVGAQLGLTVSGRLPAWAKLYLSG